MHKVFQVPKCSLRVRWCFISQRQSKQDLPHIRDSLMKLHQMWISKCRFFRHPNKCSSAKLGTNKKCLTSQMSLVRYLSTDVRFVKRNLNNCILKAVMWKHGKYDCRAVWKHYTTHDKVTVITCFKYCHCTWLFSDLRFVKCKFEQAYP